MVNKTSLNAIMLGRLRMKLEDCIERYPNLCQNIFCAPRLHFNGLWRSKHAAERLEQEIEGVIREKTPHDERDDSQSKWGGYRSPEDLCRV